MRGWLSALAALALAGLVLAACPKPNAGKAVPAPVEIDWPDAGVDPSNAPAEPDAAPQPATGTMGSGR